MTGSAHARKQSHHISQPDRSRPLAALARGCILIADDEPAILELLADVLHEAGYDVIRAADGRQALELAERHHPDIVVSDITMPGLSGTELLMGMRASKTLAATPVILMSAVISPESPPSEPFLAKPFDLERLLELIELVAPRGGQGGKGSGTPNPADPFGFGGLPR